MLLSTSEKDSVRGTSKNSMWEDAIQTLSLVRAALGLDMIMQSKMGMSLLGDWEDPQNQAETSYQQMLRDGLKLWLQRLEKSFGDYLRSWTLVRWYDPSHNAEHTPTTDIAVFGRPTALRTELWSMENDWQSSVDGLKVILQDIQEEVCLTPHLAGWRADSLRSDNRRPVRGEPLTCALGFGALVRNWMLSFCGILANTV